MQTARIFLGLFLLNNLLGLVNSQLKYADHITVLDRLFAQGPTQDLVANSMYKALKRIDQENFLSILGRNLKIQEDAQGEDASILKFTSEMDAESSTGESTAKSSSNTNIEPQCLADLMAFIQHIKLNVTAERVWALRMADATGKPGSGILSGSFTFLGDFDECRAVTGKYKSVFPVEKERKFLGQYCVGQYSINLKPFPSDGYNYKWGVCIPDSCSEHDALQIANLALERTNVTQITFESMTCNMRTVPWTARAVVMFTMIGITAFLVAVGTALDIKINLLPKWRQGKEEGKEERNSVNGDAQSLPKVDSIFRAPNDAESAGNGNLPQESANSMARRKSLVIKIFLAFSAFTNASKLLSFNQAPGTLTSMNGLRVISINWVILGHTGLILLSAANNVGGYVQDALTRYSFQVLVNATFSVDTFFVMSGLLLTYATLNHMKKTDGKVNWLKFYLHRYMRLTPVYMITFGIYLSCIPYLVDGPLLPQRDGFEQDPNCQHNWWGNLLYVQNLVKFKTHYCGSWAWYLAVDMQFYVVSPLMLIPLYRKPKLGYLVVALFFLMTTITPIVLVVARNYPAGRTHLSNGRPKLGDENYDIYISPYCRMGSYLVGVVTGFILHRTKGQPVRMHRALVAAGWVVSIALGLMIVYGLKDYYVGPGMTITMSAFYTAFARIAWGMAVAWVIFTCHTGYGGPVNAFLSWKIWVPLARLTYTVYLIHMILLFVLGSTARTPYYMTDWTIVRLYMATVMASYSLAVVVSTLFEAPGLALEKVLFDKKKQ